MFSLILSFSRFEQLPQDLNFLPLDFRNESILLFSFSDFYLLNSLLILIRNILFPFDNRLLNQLKTLVVQFFYLIFLLRPLSNLLVLHQPPS
jgi:hypothetical protein